MIIDQTIKESETKIDKTGTLSYFIKYPINEEGLEELNYYGFEQIEINIG